MPKTSDELRALWKDFECNEDAMVLIPFQEDRIRVAPQTAPAWEALAAVLDTHGYVVRDVDTDSYNCRKIKGSDKKSLHSYGIALDLNWTTNPYLDHSGRRNPRFSEETTQARRANDVRLGRADTDMTEAMIDDILAIKTVDGVSVFQWGGNWKTVKDAMHFEIDVSPDELTKGLDPASVNGNIEAADALSTVLPSEEDIAEDVQPERGEPHKVTARNGLRLRGGPSTEFGIIKAMAAGTLVYVNGREGDWSAIDLKGDGLIDGFAFSAFLARTNDVPSSGDEDSIITPSASVGFSMTVSQVASMFPFTRRSNIERNLPFILTGLAEHGLADRNMTLMALATIRAETEGFVPISEGRSRFNTVRAPFDRYDAGTSIGRNLGNTLPGDGARFKGRGYIQLTGRFNYTRIGQQLSVDLVSNPDLANSPDIAGRILARFLKNAESRIRSALARDDLRSARRAVNGGSHGLDRFSDAYRRGLTATA